VNIGLMICNNHHPHLLNMYEQWFNRDES